MKHHIPLVLFFAVFLTLLDTSIGYHLEIAGKADGKGGFTFGRWHPSLRKIETQRIKFRAASQARTYRTAFVGSERGPKIEYIHVKNELYNGYTGADVTIVAGGIGKPNATIKFRSEAGFGLNYSIYVKIK